MAKGTGQYVSGYEVTQNTDGSYNVPGIGVVGTSQSGPTPTADANAGSVYVENAKNYANYYDSAHGGSGSSGSSSNRNISEPEYKYVSKPQRKEFASDLDWYKAANEAALSLLNPYNLPSSIRVPVEGISHSQDIIAPPKFEVTSGGNIMRTDYTQSGEVGSFIPNLGGWRQVGDGRNDPDVGDAYGMQISPYAFTTRFVRGDDIGEIPAWYNPDSHSSWLDTALDIAHGRSNKDYMSLLPGEENYISSSSYSGPSLIPLASSPSSATIAAAPTAIAPRLTSASPAWEGSFWSEDVDIDAELRALGHDPGMYAPEQKAAILAAIKQLQGGR